MKYLTLTLALVFLALLSYADEKPAGQVIKGRVVDAESRYEVIGATIVVLGTDPLKGAASDNDGYFKIEDVAPGRYALKISYLGYNDRVLQNILVTAGKEVFLEVAIEEKITKTDEVVITDTKPTDDKTRAANEYAAVSARSFSLAETQRFAGANNDPARMAANFAGVTMQNDSRNDIIIRGNSPTGMLWRLEGIDIPNPNHFAAAGTTGGPVSMLNDNQLANSDFFTGAFPAEYGNATSGVFDLKLRNGNKDKYEYIAQIGFNGFEAGIEGPVFKKNRGSIMANYRYSVLGLFSAVGLDFGTGSAVPKYQDLSVKLDLPTEKFGRFSAFTLAGESAIDLISSTTNNEENNFGANYQDTYPRNYMFVTGLSNTYYFNPKMYGKIDLSYSNSYTGVDVDTFNQNFENLGRFFERDMYETRLRGAYTLNYKFNAKLSASGGVVANQLGYDYKERNIIANLGWVPEQDGNGSLNLYQSFMQAKYKATERLTLLGGYNFVYLSLKGQTDHNPRAGASYQLSPTQSINAGWGIYSQTVPLQMYFVLPEDPNTNVSNEDLDFMRSTHYVLGYTKNISTDIKLKVETYYQTLSHVPVTMRPSSFSAVNLGASFNGIPDEDSLVSTGTGINQGIELTFEKSFSKGYYFLVTTSLFDSKYKGSDGIERNTAFNGQYVVNALGGVEFKLGEKNTLTFDTRFTYAGGRRYTPFDSAASAVSVEPVYQTDKAFSLSFDDYFRLDFKPGMRRNGKKITQEWFVDLQNVLGVRNIFDKQWDRYGNKTVNLYQLGFFPNVQYRLTF